MNFSIIPFLLLLLVIYCRTEKYYKPPLTFNLIDPYRSFLDRFAEYKSNEPEYQQNYKNETFLRLRQERFQRMREIIQNHNDDFKKGYVTYSRKIMPYADWDPEMKKKRLCGTRLPKKPRALTNAQILRTIKSWPKLPPGTQVNNCHFPNPVKDQQTCGCCWAFATLAVTEAALMIEKNIKLDLSVQHIVDCDETNDGCDGGWPTSAIQYIKLNGLASGTQYQYKNTKQAGCRKAGNRNVLPPQFIFKPMEIEFRGDEESLRKLLYRIKVPVVGAIHANEALMSANTGYYKNETCPKNDPNHAIINCGFGINKATGEYYWILRNSWGPFWGENGYIKMAANNTCGMANFAMYPVVTGSKNLDPFMGEVFEKPAFQPKNRRGRD